jgi:protein-disulfide isomerase
MRRSLLVLAFLLATAPARARAEHSAFDPATVYKVPLGHSPTEGPADAPITIVVWSDYACGYCNRVQPTLDQLARLFPGQLRFVHRELPLDDDNTVAAEAGLAAAAQHRFRPMHDRLFGVFGRVDRTSVELLASQIGLDMVRFRGDLDAGTYRAEIIGDTNDARALGITGTPTFFINGRAVHGNQALKVFVDVVDQELARATRVAATHPPDLYAALVADGHATADGPPESQDPPAELDPRAIYRIGLGLPGHQLGPDDAPVTIVEWSDFQCPYCARQAPVMAHVHAKYGDKVRIIYRHLPMIFHRYAELAAEAGVAAAEQGKFWAFHDQVFAHAGKLTRADLETYAQAAGLDVAKLRAALDDRRFRDVVAAEAGAAESLGVDGTPTTFINGRPVVGSQSEEVFDEMVDLELAEAQRAIAHGIPAKDVYALDMSNASGVERADPSRVPVVSAIQLTQPAIDRERSVAAACRRHDKSAAAALAGTLAGDAKKRAEGICHDEGVDLP